MLRRQASTSAHRNPERPRAEREPAPDQRPSGRGTDRRDTGSSDSGPARQKARLRSARCHRLRRNFGSGGVGQDRVSARELRTQYGPRASAHGHARRNQGFGRGSCRTRLQGLRSMQTGKAGKRDASSKSAERRTARASALTGSPRGNRNGLRPGMDPGGRGVRACPDYRPSKPPITKGPLRRNRTRRDSGGRQQCWWQRISHASVIPAKAGISLTLIRPLQRQGDSSFRWNDERGAPAHRRLSSPHAS